MMSVVFSFLSYATPYENTISSVYKITTYLHTSDIFCLPASTAVPYWRNEQTLNRSGNRWRAIFVILDQCFVSYENSCACIDLMCFPLTTQLTGANGSRVSSFLVKNRSQEFLFTLPVLKTSVKCSPTVHLLIHHILFYTLFTLSANHASRPQRTYAWQNVLKTNRHDCVIWYRGCGYDIEPLGYPRIWF